tara:strand:- start:167 stop:301 length:135 start_codon:yes stop_codon:yes gene_type:complete
VIREPEIIYFDVSHDKSIAKKQSDVDMPPSPQNLEEKNLGKSPK